MPRVKIDYVVSFSSEDSDNQASNLLAWDVTKKKWLCNKGELSCSIVLQLVKAVKIESINIGAHHAALIEVLVGLSEKPNDPFEVLVPNSVLLTPVESRREEGIERVRSFSGNQLTSEVKLKKWDRIRVVCSQPYNKHCKFGLSFIHIFEPEEANKVAPAVPSSSTVPSRLLQLDTFSSDEDEFRPGQLFALSQQEKTNNTGAQIRQASSQALKNISDNAAKLLKTPISKTSNKDQNRSNNECTSRKKESLLYEDEDDEPHSKIDRIVQRHKESKKEESRGKLNQHNKANSSLNNEKQDGGKKTPHKTNDAKIDSSSCNKKRKRSDDVIQDKLKQGNSSSNEKQDGRRNTPLKTNDVTNDSSASSKKRKRSDDDLTPGPLGLPLSEVLSGVEFAISGYVNPQRAALRSCATALGATYCTDWRPSCTHLICAFPNTPKLKTVRASKARTVAVTGEWVEQCHRRRRRLPWQWYATEPQRRVAPALAHCADTEHAAEEMDTDDEIEKVLKKQKKKRSESPSPGSLDTSNDKRNSDDKSQDDIKKSEDISDDGNVSRDSDIAFVKDERIQANITIFESDSDTEEDTKGAEDDGIDENKELPNFFDGRTFLISELNGGYEREQLARYVRAYGGLVLNESELLEDSTVDYEIRSDSPSKSERDFPPKCRVRPEWVWDCHRQGKCMPTLQYEL